MRTAEKSLAERRHDGRESNAPPVYGGLAGKSEAAAGCREGRPGSGPGGPRCRENPEKAQTEIKYGSEVTAQGALNL